MSVFLKRLSFLLNIWNTPLPWIGQRRPLDSLYFGLEDHLIGSPALGAFSYLVGSMDQHFYLFFLLPFIKAFFYYSILEDQKEKN